MTSIETKERGIIFSGEMVRAILEGRKTQTRRVAKFKPLREGLNFGFSGLDPDDQGIRGWVLSSRGAGGCWNERTHPLRCPYGFARTILWVRETWAGCCGRYAYKADKSVTPRWIKDGVSKDLDKVKWRPSIYMKRHASRITLEIVNIRVERLKEISEEDAKAEGTTIPYNAYTKEWLQEISAPYVPKGPTFREHFFCLWEKINGKRGFGVESNPWVFVVEFRRL